MLTWIDEKGDTHVVLHPADVPETGRSLVRVVVADREAGTRDLFYVADLTKKKDDGSYDTRAMRRREWEDEIEKRREGYLAKVAPPPRPAPNGSGAAPAPAPAPAPGNGAYTVIIYGASWCGPCHEAADYLKKKGVPFVMKDIESTPGAAAEMQEKLARAGRRGGSIPVIDVRGQIMVGYSAQALDRLLEKAAAGTTL
ncbi:MAG: glutaredoxin domain-containing protein [Minicystis sp.]